MKKSNHKGKVLQEHKKVGQKLIPPLMQLVNMKEVSFQKDTLPCLIWMSAIFLRNKDQNAVQIFRKKMKASILHYLMILIN